VYAWAGSGRAAKAWTAHAVPCTDVAFHPRDASILATGSWDGQVAVWPRAVPATATESVQ